jgi:hypothetical protein
VISRGEMSQTYPSGELSYETVGLLMAGAHEKPGSGKGDHHAIRA